MYVRYVYWDHTCWHNVSSMLCSTLNFDTGSPSEPRVHWFYYTSWPASPRNSFVSTSPALGLHRCRGSLFPLGWPHQQTLRVRLCLSVLRSQTFMALYSFVKGLKIRHSCCIPRLFTGWFSRTIWTDFECMVLCHELYIHH